MKEQTIYHLGKKPPGTTTQLLYVAYIGNHLSEQGKLEVIDLRESTYKPVEMNVPRLPENDRSSLPQSIAYWFLLGDETFLISLRGDSCVIWCFDRHLA